MEAPRVQIWTGDLTPLGARTFVRHRARLDGMTKQRTPSEDVTISPKPAIPISVSITVWILKARAVGTSPFQR
jgi:hypothetical protein